MPETRSRLRQALEPKMMLPPPFTAVRLRELGDAFTHAQRIAAECGAGTLVHVGRFDTAEFALVLEPEEPLRTARRALHAGMAALTDALAALAEPETAITIDWPDSIAINSGIVGGGQLAWPHSADENEPPPWLVFGAMIRIVSMTGQEPGTNPSVTALAEEGFGTVLATQLMESFVRHFMVAVDAWQENGFGAVTRTYLERFPREKGIRRDIDENGDLLIHRVSDDRVERQSLLAALSAPSWLDPKTGSPVI